MYILFRYVILVFVKSKIKNIALNKCNFSYLHCISHYRCSNIPGWSCLCCSSYKYTDHSSKAAGSGYRGQFTSCTITPKIHACIFCNQCEALPISDLGWGKGRGGPESDCVQLLWKHRSSVAISLQVLTYCPNTLHTHRASLWSWQRSRDLQFEAAQHSQLASFFLCTKQTQCSEPSCDQ